MNPLYDTLVQEARMLAIHAARTGKLPADSAIFVEIETLAEAQGKGEHPSMAALMSESMQVGKAAGVTLEQLARRRTLLGRIRSRAALATPFLIGFLTLLLTFYLAFQSSELHRADLALREYQDLVAEHPQQKIYLAWRMYRFESVLNVKGPPMSQLDDYQKLIDDAKRLFVKRTAVEQLLIDSSVIHYAPEYFEHHGPCWLQDLARGLNSNALPACDATPRQTPPVGTPDSVLPEAKPLVSECAKPRSIPLARPATASADTRIDLDDYVRSVACFLQTLNIVDYDYPTDPLIYATRNKVQLLVSWLLPGLYGLLGACVFVMRDLLQRNGQSGADARIVDLLSLLLRVALGGLAGIIIGWFSLPTAQTASSSVIAVSSIPFGMAFLAGFSIESLFGLLDRWNRSVTRHEDKASATNPK